MTDASAARDAAEAEGAERATGQSEAEWWTERDALLTELMADSDFPTLGRLDADDFGLERLLDGIERHVEAASVRSRRPRPRPSRR